MKKLLALLICMWWGWAFAQTATIITIAGNGVGGYAGDGGPASAAQISYPRGMTLDDTGNIYFADYGRGSIRKIDANGIITTIAGTGTNGFSGDGGPALSAQMMPRDVAIDRLGNLYIPDNSYLIRKVSTAGIITTIAGAYGATTSTGDGGPASAATLRPSMVSIDTSGNLYISDWNFPRVRMINGSGIISTVAGNGSYGHSGDGGPATAARLNNLMGVYADQAGNFFTTSSEGGIVAPGRNMIRKVDNNGIISTLAGTGFPAFSGDGGLATAAALSSPADIAEDGAGNLYIADWHNNRIRKISTTGIITTIAGTGVAGYSGDGGPATAADLSYPLGIAVDDTGNIFISDAGNSRIRKIISGNHIPSLADGNIIHLDACSNQPLQLDTPLAVTDADAGQTLTWTLYAPPVHGTAAIVYSTVATSGVVTPTGLWYTAFTGYTGPDTFRVRVDDGISQIIATLIITVDSFPNAGAITGATTLCPGDTTTLHNLVTGGVWSSSNTAVAGINTIGKVTALTAGIDTIRYIVSNTCGNDTAVLCLNVQPTAICKLGTPAISGVYGLNLSPNPAHGNFTMHVADALVQPVRFTVTNMLGQQVLCVEAVTNEMIKAELPAGTYVVRAESDGHRAMQRLVVE